MIYLDHQASTSMHPDAARSVHQATIEHIANPHSSDHAAGWNAADAIDLARQSVAEAIRGEPDEVVFTSGATEADNLALLGLSDPTGKRNRIVVGAIEHKAVLGPARELARRGLEVAFAPVNRDGVIDVDALVGLIDDRTLLVSLMLVNNETGVVQPVAAASAACFTSGARLHVDAAQALGWLPIDVDGAGIDLLSISGHKMGGPKGVGALWVRRAIRQDMRPIFYGGEQEDGLRPGTLPTPLCVGFGVACKNLPDRAEVEAWRERTALLEAALLRLLPGARINGARRDRHPGCVSLTMPGLDADALVALLQPEVAVSRGSACTSGVPEPSHVLRAMGLSKEECDSTLRISTGRFTRETEIAEAVAAFDVALLRLMSQC